MVILEEGRGERYDRAAKHFIIAAKLGYANALDRVKEGYMGEILSKEDYEAALRGHQAAVDETKSEQRDAAATFALEAAEDDDDTASE